MKKKHPVFELSLIWETSKVGVLAPDAEGKEGFELGPLVRYYCYAAMLWLGTKTRIKTKGAVQGLK